MIHDYKNGIKFIPSYNDFLQSWDYITDILSMNSRLYGIGSSLTSSALQKYTFNFRNEQSNTFSKLVFNIFKYFPIFWIMCLFFRMNFLILLFSFSYMCVILDTNTSEPNLTHQDNQILIPTVIQIKYFPFSFKNNS